MHTTYFSSAPSDPTPSPRLEAWSSQRKPKRKLKIWAGVGTLGKSDTWVMTPKGRKFEFALIPLLCGKILTSVELFFSAALQPAWTW